MANGNESDKGGEDYEFLSQGGVKCLVPLDDGSPCGKESKNIGGMNLHRYNAHALQGVPAKGRKEPKAAKGRDESFEGDLPPILYDYGFKGEKYRRVLRAWERTNKGPGELEDLLRDENVPTNKRRSILLQMFGQEEMESLYYPSRVQDRTRSTELPRRHSRDDGSDPVDQFMDDMWKAIRIKNFMSIVGSFEGQNHPGGAVQVPTYEPDPETGEMRMQMHSVPLNQDTGVTVQVLKIIQELVKRRERGEQIGVKDFLAAFKEGAEMARSATPKTEDQKHLFDSMTQRLENMEKEFLRGQIDLIQRGHEKELGMLEQRLQETGLDKDMERLQKYKEAGLIGGGDIESTKLQARLELAKWDRDFREKQLAWEHQKGEREREQNVDTLSKLVDLGVSIVQEIGRPISESVGRGLRERVIQGPSPMTSQQREAALQQLDAVTAEAERAKQRLQDQGEE